MEERLAPHRFSKPAHSTTLPSLLNNYILIEFNKLGKSQKAYNLIIFLSVTKFFSANLSPFLAATSNHLIASFDFFHAFTSHVHNTKISGRFRITKFSTFFKRLECLSHRRICGIAPVYFFCTFSNLINGRS